MLLLLKNAHVVDCDREELADLLICGEKIAAVQASIQADFPDLKVLDLEGRMLLPGLIDGHVHVTGGGGEMGFSSRVREARVTDFIQGGVTTVLGLLGTDTVTRSLENLYAKVKSLEEEGISAFMLTGGYACPSRTLTGEVMRDLVLIDKVIGVKMALSDHRSSAPSAEQAARTCAEARVGGLISAKAGLSVIHMGSSPKGFGSLKEMLSFGDVPMQNVLPTHCGRDDVLFGQAIEYAQRGGNIDLTAELISEDGPAAGRVSAARRVRSALDRGVALSRLTISSDNYGSVPRFNGRQECIGFDYSKGPVLYRELLRMVLEERLPWTQALQPLTINPAARMGIAERKGKIAPGYDADLLLLGRELQLEAVWARGKTALYGGKMLFKNKYDTE